MSNRGRVASKKPKKVKAEAKASIPPDQQIASQEIRRQQMLAAAEKRRSDELNRGLKNPVAAEKLMERRSQDENPDRRAGGEDGEPVLRWNMG